MTILIAAAAVFVLMHLLIAGTRLRGVIVGVIGEGAYAGLFSLGSVAALVWLGMAYGAARGQGEILWATPEWGKLAQAVIQFVALMLIVPGLLTPNPTAVGQMGAVEKPATGTEPSNLCVIGRYILQPEIFGILDKQERGAGNEIQLTDAMAQMIGKTPFHAVKTDCSRFDCGDKAGISIEILHAGSAIVCARRLVGSFCSAVAGTTFRRLVLVFPSITLSR
jgi:hypothetical protein